jgi:hypothetical protein
VEHISGSAIFDQGSTGNFERDVCPLASLTLIGTADPAIFCFDEAFVLMCRKTELPRIRLKNDRAALTAVSTGGTALWNIFFTSPCDDAVPAFTCYELEFNTICEHNLIPIKGENLPKGV